VALDPDAVPDLAMSGRVDLGDPIQQGAVEAGSSSEADF
jgi:hypothetical protein